MKTTKPKSIQSIAQLWTSLPERHQEMLSGGAPKVNGGHGSDLQGDPGDS